MPNLRGKGGTKAGSTIVQGTRIIDVVLLYGLIWRFVLVGRKLFWSFLKKIEKWKNKFVIYKESLKLQLEILNPL